MTFYNHSGKRFLDLLISIFLIVLTAPLIIFVWILLCFQNGGKPFFYQERPGKNIKSFYIIKFKTMNDEKDSSGNMKHDKERLTRLGKWVRKLSIDELPQLLNVIKGDMSLIGPRPLLFKYLPLYSQEQLCRHDVKPGITGWAQINGRNSISWKKKFEFDLYYVDNLSFWFDLKILFLTTVKVIKRDGVNQSNERPMLPFNGHN